jgi:phage tail sheath protein FI
MASVNVTPGVYIQEQNAFPNSVVAIETAVPVFIGYTEKAVRNGKSLKGKPVRIDSILEYMEFFGEGYPHQFKLASGSFTPFNASLIIDPIQQFYFYNGIRLFYENGGNTCYIMSIGTYGREDEEPEVNEIKSADFSDDVFAVLAKEPEPSVVVLPDIISAYKKDPDGCYEVYKRLLKHCHDTQSRVAILDVNYDDPQTDVRDFREHIGTDYLSYGAAYYPWLNTAVVATDEITLANLDCPPDQLKMQLPEPAAGNVFAHWNAVTVTDTAEQKQSKLLLLHKNLLAVSPVYVQIINEIKGRLNLLPPAAAMAGVYTMVDQSRGVWKSPANISLSGVISPSVNLSHEEQESLNVDAVTGKSVNAIRPFPGIGTLVWGARTLDGNSVDWRYINVRRTMIMIEQSLKLALKVYVFEPNEPATWLTIKSMMENFLINLWKQGALSGAKPEQAFNVMIGLETTMTATDIQEGILRVTVLVAIVRPAEFIEITFQQQQQPAS